MKPTAATFQLPEGARFVGPWRLQPGEGFFGGGIWRRWYRVGRGKPQKLDFHMALPRI